DGRYIGAALDRNGLRPMRYSITTDGLVVAGSEVGLFDLDDHGVRVKGRLGPGQMLAVDLEQHLVLDADRVKQHLLKQSLQRNSRLLSVPMVPAPIEPIPNERLQALFGYTRERSEEHTSELQSQSNLVCRLLLEKKKN